jgi:hypothetical protein
VPQYLANQDLYHALLDLRRGLHSLLNQLDRHKNLAGAEEVAGQMDDHLGEIISAVRMPRVALGRKRPSANHVVPQRPSSAEGIV